MSTLAAQIKSGKKRIAVYGMGNIGGAIAAAWLRRGVHVIGVDVSERLLDDIRAGRSHAAEKDVPKALTSALKGQARARVGRGTRIKELARKDSSRPGRRLYDPARLGG